MSADPPRPAVAAPNPDRLASGVARDPARRPFPSRRVMFGVAGSILVLDQVSKALVRAWLPLHSSVTIIPELLDFRYVRNTGAAFGLLNAADIPFKAALMTAIALFALIAIAVYASRATRDEPLSKLGLAAVLGGAVGNLIDRVTSGYVVDFVDVYWRSWHFWAFNVADAAITAGACCLILDMAFLHRHVSETV